MQPGFEYNCQGNVVNSCASTHLQNVTRKHLLFKVTSRTGSFACVNPTSDYQWKVRVTDYGRNIAHVGIRVWWCQSQEQWKITIRETSESQTVQSLVVSVLSSSLDCF